MNNSNPVKTQIIITFSTLTLLQLIIIINTLLNYNSLFSYYSKQFNYYLFSKNYYSLNNFPCYYYYYN